MTISLFILIVTAFCILPLYLVIITSFSNEADLSRSGFKLFPDAFSLDAYRLLFSSESMIYRAYSITILTTAIGTAMAVTVTAMAGFCLANKKVRFRHHLALFFYFTMLFSGGMVPWYLINRSLGFYNNIWALIIPGLVFNPFNMYIVRNFMERIPDSLSESATIDGAHEVTIAFRIVMPIATPVLATITLFYGVAYWNSWWNAIMLINNPDLYPLQYLLFQLRSQLDALRLNPDAISAIGRIPGESLRMATTAVTIGPIILLYPLLQRFFIKGIVIGAIKG